MIDKVGSWIMGQGYPLEMRVARTILLFEYETVLRRPEHRKVHNLSDDLLETAIRVLADQIQPVVIDFQWKPKLRDPDDEKALESATDEV